MRVIETRSQVFWSPDMVLSTLRISFSVVFTTILLYRKETQGLRELGWLSSQNKLFLFTHIQLVNNRPRIEARSIMIPCWVPATCVICIDLYSEVRVVLPSPIHISYLRRFKFNAQLVYYFLNLTSFSFPSSHL